MGCIRSGFWSGGCDLTLPSHGLGTRSPAPFTVYPSSVTPSVDLITVAHHTGDLRYVSQFVFDPVVFVLLT